MLGRLFRGTSAATARHSEIEVCLPVRINGDRVGPIFSLPLARALTSAGLGTVAGHRLALNDAGEVVGVGLSVRLVSKAGRAIDRVVSELERLDAPRGSSLTVEQGAQPITFGASEGLGLYLSRAVLRAVDDSPTAHLDVVAECIDAFGDLATYQGSAFLEKHVALYFYGANFNRMAHALAFVLATCPACQDAETLRLT
jgi:hypothetical protein